MLRKAWWGLNVHLPLLDVNVVNVFAHCNAARKRRVTCADLEHILKLSITNKNGVSPVHKKFCPLNENCTSRGT